MDNSTPTEKVQSVKSRVLPSRTKEEFLRAAWIELAKEDAPMEVFRNDFGAVGEIEHQVAIDTLNVEVEYHASIGYDRQEPYIAYEKYYEQEPYLTTETYYDHNTKSNRTRQVTKYRRVEKQRQVTRYKTVTDWSPISGTHRTESLAFSENKRGTVLDDYRFRKCFCDIPDDCFVYMDAEESKAYAVSDETYDALMSIHNSHILESVRNELPGDHAKDISYKGTNIINTHTSLYMINEYTATISYLGQTYTKKAFQNGEFVIGGDSIKNPFSLENAVAKIQRETDAKVKEREKNAGEAIWNSTKKFSFLSMLLFAWSIITSLFIRFVPLVIIAFAVSLGFYIFNKQLTKKTEAKEKQLSAKEIHQMRVEAQNRIRNYESEYKIKQREALDNKLMSLGLEPVRADELTV